MDRITLFIIIYIVASAAFLFFIWKFLKFIIRYYDWIPDVYRLRTYQVTVPKYDNEEEQQRKTPKERLVNAEMLFATLGGVRAQRDWRAKLYGRHDHFALEIVADRDGLVTFYVSVPGFMETFLEQQILAQYPHAHMERVEDFNIFHPTGHIYSALCTLKKQYIFPIKTYQKMEVDPLNGLTNVLSKFAKTEGAAIQIIARSA